MKKSYKIEVDCANCAQKMEDAANTVAGVANATVSFMTQKMKVEFSEGADPHDTMVNVLAACKKVEDDCEIFDICCAAGCCTRSTASPSPSPAVTHSPFCRYATSSPGRGKSFLKGRGLGKEMKFAWTAKGSPFGRAGKSKGFD